MSKESKKPGCFQSCAGALVIGVIALFVIAYCVVPARNSRSRLRLPNQRRTRSSMYKT